MRHDINTIGIKENVNGDIVPVVLEQTSFSNDPNLISEIKQYFIKCHKHSMIGHIKKFIATKFLIYGTDFEKVVKYKMHYCYCTSLSCVII